MTAAEAVKSSVGVLVQVVTEQERLLSTKKRSHRRNITLVVYSVVHPVFVAISKRRCVNHRVVDILVLSEYVYKSIKSYVSNLAQVNEVIRKSYSVVVLVYSKTQRLYTLEHVKGELTDATECKSTNYGIGDVRAVVILLHHNDEVRNYLVNCD